MKAELIVKPHSVMPDTQVIEVHYDGQFIATVAGADGPGVRIVSKHAANIQEQPPRPPIPGYVQVLFDLE